MSARGSAPCFAEATHGTQPRPPGVRSRPRDRKSGLEGERPRKPGRSAAGFTLIEVLIAAALLGFGLTVLLTAASRCLAVMRQAENYQNARWALQLGELEHPLIQKNESGWDPEEWAVSGEEYPGGITFSRTVEPRAEDTEDGLYVIRSRVTWARRGSTSFEEITRYVFVPSKYKPTS